MSSLRQRFLSVSFIVVTPVSRKNCQGHPGPEEDLLESVREASYNLIMPFLPLLGASWALGGSFPSVLERVPLSCTGGGEEARLSEVAVFVLLPGL